MKELKPTKLFGAIFISHTLEKNCDNITANHQSVNIMSYVIDRINVLF